MRFKPWFGSNMIFSKKVETILSDIASLRIQGATKVQKAGVKAVENWVVTTKAVTEQALEAEFWQLAKRLVHARTTEPGLRSAVRIVWKNAVATQGTVAEKKELVLLECKQFEKNRVNALLQISKIGAKLIPNNAVILTHCHSHSVEAILVLARKKIKMVYSTETRPLFQGRITATNLSKHKIPVTQIVDSAAASVLKNKKIDLFITGADAVLASGDVVNKIGTAEISLAAKRFGVPHLVATSTLTLDPLTFFGWPEPIENRSGKEVWKDKPNSVKIWNPVFDQTPATLVNKIICEDGAFFPKKFVQHVKKKSDWEKNKKGFEFFFSKVGFDVKRNLKK